MTSINQTDRNQRAYELVKHTKLANFAKMANMLISLFGLDDAFSKYVKPKRDGQEVEMKFPALEGSLKFILTRKRKNFEVRVEEVKSPEAIIIIDVSRDKATKIVSDIIRSKSNLFGLLKIVPKILTGKIKIKGSIGAIISLCRIMMVGKNEIYKEEPIE